MRGQEGRERGSGRREGRQRDEGKGRCRGGGRGAELIGKTKYVFCKNKKKGERNKKSFALIMGPVFIALKCCSDAGSVCSAAAVRECVSSTQIGRERGRVGERVRGRREAGGRE